MTILTINHSLRWAQAIVQIAIVIFNSVVFQE
jgi:hypothetical protein